MQISKTDPDWSLDLKWRVSEGLKGLVKIYNASCWLTLLYLWVDLDLVGWGVSWWHFQGECGCDLPNFGDGEGAKAKVSWSLNQEFQKLRFTDDSEWKKIYRVYIIDLVLANVCKFTPSCFAGFAVQTFNKERAKGSVIGGKLTLLQNLLQSPDRQLDSDIQQNMEGRDVQIPIEIHVSFGIDPLEKVKVSRNQRSASNCSWAQFESRFVPEGS